MPGVLPQGGGAWAVLELTGTLTSFNPSAITAFFSYRSSFQRPIVELCRYLSLIKSMQKNDEIEIFALPIHPAMYDAAINESPPSESRTFAARRAAPYETQ